MKRLEYKRKINIGGFHDFWPGQLKKIELPLIGTRKTFGEGNQEFSLGHITLEMSIGNCNRNVA